MNQELANRLGDELIRIGKDFKAGNSNMTEDEAIDFMDTVTHIKIGREVLKSIKIEHLRRKLN